MGLKLRIIPSLLLKDGRLVKGRRMKDHRDAGNPVTTVRALCAQGADEILLLDISEDAPHWDILESVADECTVPLCYGGGLQTREDADFAFRRGADKIFLPIKKRPLIDELCSSLGRQAVIVGVDDIRRPEFVGGVEHRLLDVSREGSRTGYCLPLPETNAPLIIEGGAGTLRHIAEAFRAGASAVALGTMLVFSDNNIVKIKRYLAQQGLAVRC